MTDSKQDVIEATNTKNTLPLSSLIEFKFGNSRKSIKQSKLDELKASIKELGILQPILVRPSQEQSGMFEVVAGNTRWIAAKEIPLDVIPVNIRKLDDKQAYEAHLAENLDRADLSVVDEARAAQKFVSLYEGSHFEAAQRLGWSEKKIQDRLQLLRCSENVLTALEEDKITISHAVILSSFSDTLQNGTLNKIIKENWTISYLKERSGKAKKFLHTAKFDVKGCDNCEHNTVHQNDLFDTKISAKAQCANLQCWTGKTEHWLSVQKAKAEEKYGKVLLWVESGEADRNTVTSLMVGEEQYQSGCATCESRTVIMDDRYGKEGNLVESQCIDTICFAKCQKSYKKSLEKPVETNIPSASEDGSPDKVSKKDVAIKNNSTSPKEVVQKTPKGVAIHEQALLRKTAFELLNGEPKLFHSMMLAILTELTGIKTDVVSDKYSFDTRVKEAYSHELEQINEAIKHSIIHFLSEKKDESPSDSKSPTKTLISVLSTLDNRKDIAIAAWNADKATLSNYTIDGVSQICKDSGFVQAFNDDKTNVDAKVNFEKISKKGKAKFIEEIIAYKAFDWSGFAPQSMLKHVKA